MAPTQDNIAVASGLYSLKKEADARARRCARRMNVATEQHGDLSVEYLIAAVQHWKAVADGYEIALQIVATCAEQGPVACKAIWPELNLTEDR